MTRSNSPKLTHIMRSNPRKIKQIKDLLKLGFTLPEVVRRMLGMSFTSFASLHDLKRNELSMAMNGSRLYPSIRAAVAGALKISENDMTRLIDEHTPGR